MVRWMDVPCQDMMDVVCEGVWLVGQEVSYGLVFCDRKGSRGVGWSGGAAVMVKVQIMLACVV